MKDGVSDQACSGDHKKASSKDCSFVCKNEKHALLNEVINLWLSVQVYRVKLGKDIKNAPEHYMAKLNQVLDPLLTSKDIPEQISIEKWTIKLIGGVGKSATRSLKNTTNGREKGLKLRVKVVAASEQNTITGSNHELGRILKRLQGSAEYDRMNVKVPSRILIHGPNRTSKSSLVHAFAREAKLPFFTVQVTEIEKNPLIIVSLFSEVIVSSLSIIYIEGIEVITSTGVSQILYQMESFENNGAAFVVIGTTDNVKTLVKDIKDGFDMLVHLGKLDMVSITKMVDG
ncbi:ATPase, AAA-type, core, P-loop containing nucleoside triphosphate hydrolase [Tanacetum coccineum]|uniref:ATPase, AAA-type, core, P-loop containing nucleoside triphosphate hydrolase n=1 Tax=Tanacetum coccineum TaxID=301880 RepID=A0ABQ4Z9Y6_9ASTR